MPDIGDLFSSVSRTRVSPQKSYVASYPLTAAYADTGATLQVANGQFYAVLCVAGTSGGFPGSASIKLLEGITTKQIITSGDLSASTYNLATQIFQNTSGSTQTVKLQALFNTNGSTLTAIQLISGTIVSEVVNSVFIPINAYVTNLEMVGASHQTFDPVSLLNLSQLPTVTTSSLVSNLNLYVNGFNASAQHITNANVGLSFVAFDFDGKTLAV